MLQAPDWALQLREMEQTPSISPSVSQLNRGKAWGMYRRGSRNRSFGVFSLGSLRLEDHPRLHPIQPDLTAKSFRSSKAYSTFSKTLLNQQEGLGLSRLWSLGAFPVGTVPNPEHHITPMSLLHHKTHNLTSTPNRGVAG